MRLHELTHHPPGLLRIGGTQAHDGLPDERTHLVVRGGLGQESRAKTDLEIDLRDGLRAAGSDGGILFARFAQLLLVGGNHIQPETVVEWPLEAGRGAALHVLGLDHPDAVRRLGILGAHRLLELFVELGLDRHGRRR